MANSICGGHERAAQCDVAQIDTNLKMFLMIQVHRNASGKIDNYFISLGGFDMLPASLVSVIPPQITGREELWRNTLRREVKHDVFVGRVSLGRMREKKRETGCICGV